MDSYSKGLSVQATLDNLNSYDYNHSNYQNEWLDSIEELKRREEVCDTKISDVIIKSYNDGVSQFYSFNHPNKELMNVHCNRVLSYLGLNYDPLSTPGECLDWDRLSNNKISFGNRTTSIFKVGKEISQEDFVKQSFIIYSQNDAYIKEYVKVYAKKSIY